MFICDVERRLKKFVNEWISEETLKEETVM